MELGRYVRCERLQQRRRFLSSDGKQAFCQDRLRTKYRRKLETEGWFVAHSHVSLLCKGNPMVLEPLCLPEGGASTAGGADIAVCATPFVMTIDHLPRQARDIFILAKDVENRSDFPQVVVERTCCRVRGCGASCVDWRDAASSASAPCASTRALCRTGCARRRRRWYAYAASSSQPTRCCHATCPLAMPRRRGCCVTLRFVSLNLDAFLLAGGRG